ncbi:MAG TPA: hypothetical protein DIV54_00440 [Verrucomicrobiales bacterium]|nr:hypothetical protein [Verrucomicrobiales bacterium]
MCVRLESYESEEHQKMVRSFLDGRFENTAFCLLAPDGETRLSGTGRSPSQGLRQGRGNRGPGRGRRESGVVEAMNEVAKKFRPRGSGEGALVQDFHSFRQGLNVASGDQRLLVFVVAAKEDREGIRMGLRSLMSDKEIVGKFHADFADEKSDSKWRSAVKGERGSTGIFVIRADAFGQTGTVVDQLPVDAKPEDLKKALLEANTSFAETEKRKVYSEHVAAGRRARVHFENGMPYGEDRDGDGVIDHRGGRGGRGAGPDAGERRGPPSGRRGGPPRGDRRPGQPPQRPRIRPGGTD